jgi:hypothetical protein
MSSNFRKLANRTSPGRNKSLSKSAKKVLSALSKIADEDGFFYWQEENGDVNQYRIDYKKATEYGVWR